MLSIIIFSCNKKKDYILISAKQPIAHKTPTISYFSASLSSVSFSPSVTKIKFDAFDISLVTDGYPKDISYNGIQYYGICYSKTNPNPTPTGSDNEDYFLGYGNSSKYLYLLEQTITFPNLDFDTKYYFRAYATSKKGTGYSNTSIIHTNSNIKTIGSTFWDNLNLNVSTYSDGTTIPQVTTDSVWKTTKTGAWCYYANNTSNGIIYGKLYNWYAVMGIYDESSLKDPSKRKTLAPTNYRIATTNDWNDAAQENEIYTKLSLPLGGRRSNSTGNYSNNNSEGNFWCKDNAIDSSFFKFTNSTGNLLTSDKAQSKNLGYSVRCIREK